MFGCRNKQIKYLFARLIAGIFMLINCADADTLKINSIQIYMKEGQVSTLSLFRFSGFRSKVWAFAQMGLAPRRMGKIPGLQFQKLVGSGATNGFGIRPNFGLYGMLNVWDDEQSADHFFQHHPVFKSYEKHASAVQTVFLRTSMVHGSWDGGTPFHPSVKFDPNASLAVLTRATIRKRYLWRFWRDVPGVSRDVTDKPGLLFAIGIGELPFVQQATFSLWQTGVQMMDFAYQRDDHRAVIKKTRELGWYKEELFTRFVPFRTVGSGIW